MEKIIPFNKPYVYENVNESFQDLIEIGHFSGDGIFTKRCSNFLQELLGAKVLLTTSCTHALEMIAILLEINPGDEVIMPSFTFVSTANAFVLRGAKVVFVDIDPRTMNIDAHKIEAAITNKTKAIVIVHYAGVGCDMDIICEIANEKNLYLIEDAAQAIYGTYQGKQLGTFGDFGTLSFHETKNIHCGEGGCLIINNKSFIERAEIIREKGTNRTKFFDGKIDKYSWVDLGSSYLLSDINCSFLLPQLMLIRQIITNRLNSWYCYYEHLKNLEDLGVIRLPYIPENCRHNAHIFYIKCSDKVERARLSTYLKSFGVSTTFHYIPLHSSNAGSKYCIFSNEDEYTTLESEKLLRLPLYYGLGRNEITYITELIQNFYCEKNVL